MILYSLKIKAVPKEKDFEKEERGEFREIWLILTCSETLTTFAPFSFQKPLKTGKMKNTFMKFLDCIKSY